MSYAVMVCLDGKDDWIYITKQTNQQHCWNLQPELFEDAHEAMQFAQVFQIPDKPQNVMVVDYYED
tara:strand:+ start:845 stop:1042 length:198 start_codon:yes stop_codon:yes gene_type:complete